MARFMSFATVIGLLLAVTAPGIRGDEKPAKGTAKPRNFEIRMVSTDSGFAYDQPDIEIQVGDTITWINASGAKHTATADDDSELKFDRVEVAMQKFSKRVTFDKAGKAKYHCEFHDMHGTITVK